MTSLSEVYEGGRGGPSLRRLYAGVGLFTVGVLLLVVAILITTTDLIMGEQLGLYEARRIGGVIGGVGLPAVFLGVLTVLPASPATRAAAVIGAAIALLGVGLFWHAYPCEWVGANCGPEYGDLTLETVSLYFFGTLTTFWCLFVGVANFKTRNDPGGTVKLEPVRKGETRIVEVDRPRFGLGGIGLLSGTPDGTVETQTNRPDAGTNTPPMNDGGASNDDITSPLGGTTSNRVTAGGEILDAEPTTDAADRYCGNCSQFRYVRTDSGIKPHCGYHDTLMDDMDACEEWSSRR